MAILLPHLRQLLKLSGQVSDRDAKRAIRNLEDWGDELVRRLSALGSVPVAGSGITLPIAESDVTNLITDLASKVAVTRSVNTTSPLTGGGNLTADRTISIIANGIDNALLRQGAATSVIGRSAGTVGNVADIAAAGDGDVLRRAAGVLGFGAIPESSVTSLTADLAARPTGSGTTNRVAKWIGATALGDSSITDTGTLVSVANPAAVANNSTTAGALSIQNTNVSGPTDFFALDNSGTAKASWGYGNASYADTARAGRGYLWRNTGVDFVFARTNTLDMLLDSSGRLGIGTVPETNSKLHVKNAAGGTAAVAGSLLSLENSAALYMTFKGPAATDKGVLFSNPSGAADGGILYDTPTNARGLVFRTGGNLDRVTVDSSGNVVMKANAAVNGNATLGDTSGDAHVLNGTVNANGTAGSNGQLLAVVTGLPQWASSSAVGLVAGSGTQDIVPKWAASGTSLVNSTIKDTGTEVQISPSTSLIRLNYNGGSSANGVGIYDGSTNQVGFLSSGGNATFKSDLSIASDVNGTINGAHTFKGRITHTQGRSDAGYAYNLTATAIGPNTGGGGGIKSEAGGLFDTTVGGLFNEGVSGAAIGTRNAGANNLTNIGGRFSASGGQVNYAIKSDSGDVVLNDVSGTTTIKGATTLTSSLAVNGNATLGDAAGDAHTVNGTLTCVNAVNINGNATLGDASGDTHTLNGNLTFSNAPTAGSIKFGSSNGRILIAQQVLTAASGTYTPTTGTKAVRVRMVGGGGGGGAFHNGAAGGVGSGGSSGAYFEKWIDAAGNVTGGAYVAGGGGAGATATVGAVTGGAGTDSSVVVNGTTYTAKAGLGGTAGAAYTTAPIGGAVNAGTSAGDLSGAQEAGKRGWFVSTNSTTIAFPCGGAGGNSLLGGGGQERVADGNGNSANGYGGGGGGAVDTTAAGANRVGGSGTQGVIIIEEYA